MDEHEAWRERVARAGGSLTPVIDRFYFKSIYFREPSGVLFEIATIGPGFAADEPFETLGQGLSLPPNYEHLREQLKDVLADSAPEPAGDLDADVSGVRLSTPFRGQTRANFLGKVEIKMGVRAEGPGGGSHARVPARHDEFPSTLPVLRGTTVATKAPAAGADKEEAWDFR